jgi:hypothetical protein
MRKIIENPVYMTYDEMEKEFMGKWILVTNCEYTEYNDFIRGIPVAVADKIFEGQRDGFYDKFKAPKYAPRVDLDFDYDSVPGILSFFNSLEVVGEKE